MEWIRRIIKTPIEPEDKDVFWLDISVPNYAILKYYENGEWKIVRHSEDGIAYILPIGGIPYSDLSQDVKNRIDLAKEQSDWNQNNESAVDYIKNKPNIGAKADKVEGATAGNLASLDGEGNITDSGISKDFIEDNYQHLYHCTLQEVLNPKDGDICIVPVSYDNIPITGTDDSNIFNFISVHRKVKWRVTNGAEEWFFFRWTSDNEEVITTPSLPENVTGFPIEGIVNITNSTGEVALIWDTEFRSSVQYLTLYDVVPETAYLYIAQDWVKLEDLNKQGPDNVQQIYNSPLSEVTNPKEGDICVVPAHEEQIALNYISGDETEPFQIPNGVTTLKSKVVGREVLESWKLLISIPAIFDSGQTATLEQDLIPAFSGSIPESYETLVSLVIPRGRPGNPKVFWTSGDSSYLQNLTISYEIATRIYEYISGAWVERTDLAQTLEKAKSAYQKPANGIPASDLKEKYIRCDDEQWLSEQEKWLARFNIGASAPAMSSLSSFPGAFSGEKTVNETAEWFGLDRLDIDSIVSGGFGGIRFEFDYASVCSVSTTSTAPYVKYAYIIFNKKVYKLIYNIQTQKYTFALDGGDRTLISTKSLIPTTATTYTLSSFATAFGITEAEAEALRKGEYDTILFGSEMVVVLGADTSMSKLQLWEGYRGKLYTITKTTGTSCRCVVTTLDLTQLVVKSVNDLTNYYTKTQTYTKEEVQQLVSSLSAGTFIPVAELPVASADTYGLKIYLVPSTDPQTQNIKDEFITIRSGSEDEYTYSWEQIGSTAIDLSDYVTEDALETVLANYALASAIPTALSQLSDDSTHRLVTDTEKSTWNAKYSKPSTGIPKTDLASGVQTSLGKADSALQPGDAPEISEPIVSNNDFVFRASPATKGKGSAKIAEVRGNSLVWNQLVQNGDFENGLNNWTSSNVTATDGDGEITIQPTTETYSANNFWQALNTISGHKYLLHFEYKCTGYGIVYFADANSPVRCDPVTDFTEVKTIKTSSGYGQLRFYPSSSNFSQSDILTLKKHIIVFDLTQMFGAGNEPTTVAEFEYLYWLKYFAYNAGQIINNKAMAIEVIGFNIFDGNYEDGSVDVTTGENKVNTPTKRCVGFIPVLANTNYYLKQLSGTSVNVWMAFYDENKVIITKDLPDISAATNLRDVKDKIFKTPLGCSYVRFYLKDDSDVILNISDPSRNGTYEPYKKNTVELNLTTLTGKLNGAGESVVVFPDGLKSAGSVYDEIVGNKAIKRVGVVDLGTLTWRAASGNYYAPLPSDCTNYLGALTPKDSWTPQKYEKTIFLADLVNGGICLANNTYVYIKDSAYSTTTDFTTSLSGVKLLYELAEPLVYELDESIEKTFDVEAGGTEHRLPEDTATVVNAPFAGTLKYYMLGEGTKETLDENYATKEEILPPEIFWATFGTTTKAEIDTALSAGKVIACLHDSYLYVLSNCGDSYYYLSCIISSTSRYIRLRLLDGLWQTGSANLQAVSDKVNTLTGNESDTTKYPSTKAVADAIAAGKQIFWATYGTTTAAEIDAAVAAGKIVVCLYDGIIYLLTNTKSTETRYLFSAFSTNTRHLYLTCTKSDSSWFATGVSLELTSNKVNTISGNEFDTNKYLSTKGSYDAIHPAVETTQPVGGFLPNVVYDLGELTGTITFALATPTDANIANAYYWTFETSTTAPTITWPANITWIDGSAPAISASKHYEIMIRNGYGTYLEI